VLKFGNSVLHQTMIGSILLRDDLADFSLFLNSGLVGSPSGRGLNIIAPTALNCRASTQITEEGQAKEARKA
jgi:hypothetical protein